MKIHMPLLPDMQQKHLRGIDAEFPEDLTQEEFWNFVLLTGAQLFGEKIPRGKDVGSRWNIAGSFDEFVLNRRFPNV